MRVSWRGCCVALISLNRERAASEALVLDIK